VLTEKSRLSNQLSLLNKPSTQTVGSVVGAVCGAPQEEKQQNGGLRC